MAVDNGIFPACIVSQMERLHMGLHMETQKSPIWGLSFFLSPTENQAMAIWDAVAAGH